MPFDRAVIGEILARIRQGPPLLQVITGPRQVGKTTAALRIRDELGWPTIVAAADEPLPPGPEWIETQWTRARALLAQTPAALLILDEVQKVVGWSQAVKRLWDEDRRDGRRIEVLLLGSSAQLLQSGLTESLAGRFFLHRCMHWSWPECRAAFRWDLERWLCFGGYPGAAPLVSDPDAWRTYVLDSLVETVIARDVLQLQPVNKPALLRHLFALACSHPAQILSYTKMLGQLHDAGNTTTLAGYVRLLETAFLLSGLPAWSGSVVRQRGSSPKLVLWNNALATAVAHLDPAQLAADATRRGRLVENAVGAHLLNHLPPAAGTVHYWRDGPSEVDYVVKTPRHLWALEVKSGRAGRVSGLAAFQRKNPHARALIIGGGGIPLEEFFATPPSTLLQ